MTPNLSRLLRPKSIAIFGGSWAANVVEQCLKAGFDGEIWPVHPTRETVHGVKAYPSLAALPSPPDAAWIGVNRDATIEIVRDLNAMGAGGAVCFASGFRETDDGADRNAALLDAAGEMPIIGPNCYGALNYLDGATLWPDQHGGKRVDSGVAIITQSSNIAINITMQQRGLPIAYALTAGNQAQIGLADMACALLEDARVTAIGLHIEGVGDTAAFEALAARAREKNIPIVAIKVGRSDQARTATISHTASLAGSDAGSQAFFRRLGIPLLPSLPALIETLKLLHTHGPLKGRDVLSMSCSGGEASLMADSALAHDLHFRPYKAHEKAAISATLNPMVTVANPLDYHTFIWNDDKAMTATFAAAMRPGFDLSMLILDFPRADRCSHETWEPAVKAIARAAKKAKARAAVVASLGELLPEDRCEAFIAAGIAPLCGIDEALLAADAAAQIGEAWAVEPAEPILPPTIAPAENTLVLDETESKFRLSNFGIQVPAGRIATTPQEAERAAEELRVGDYKLAVKALGIAHKTEADAVRLNLQSATVVKNDAWVLIKNHQCDVLVEHMVIGGLVEIIIGVTRDPVYGLILTFGAGGVLTELLQDSVSLMLPTDEQAVSEALAGLRISKLLNGYRGNPPADRWAVIDAIMAVARFAGAYSATLEELDINPLIVCQQGAFAADALIKIRTRKPHY